jgi:hypothetical protein
MMHFIPILKEAIKLFQRRLTDFIPMLGLLLLLLCASCSSTTWSSGDPVFERSTCSYIQCYSTPDGPSLHGIEGKAPCNVGAVVDFFVDSNPKTGVVFIKVEIDFGDGSGWRDITSSMKDMDYYYYDGLDPAHSVLHTYAQPGEYRVRARITYWDGEVIESRQDIGGEPLVKVTQ